ncbi:MAG: tRNA (adenosine(37)-N6)-dimethylallyltransferase MiaA [Holosporales bacterium]|jgi:tRNA dimethylallyltransferase|nr:tRNA (adenosine(37)-N6)-dimethylallyltransferase MiaA [Holosporales bacterium]
MRKVLIVAGPTASGKSTYAIEKAKSISGEIINCDSMQVYTELKILTAHPTQDEMASVPHKLFSYLQYDQQSNAADWARAAASAINETLLAGRVPIVVGGTGLYIDTLINGISPVPAISAATRAVANELAKNDYSGLCSRLYAFDSRLEYLIPPEKRHQVIRAYEIFIETGMSILHFRSFPRVQFLRNVRYECELLECERSILYRRIHERFDRMLAVGAIEEVEQLLCKVGQKYSVREMFTTFPIFKIIGAREIALYINGLISFESMKQTATTSLRHYAKRQITWFKNNDSIRKLVRIGS